MTTTIETPALDSAAHLIEFADEFEHKRIEECISIAKASAAGGDAEAIALLEALEARLPRLIREFYAAVMDEGYAVLAPYGEHRSTEDANRLGDWAR